MKKLYLLTLLILLVPLAIAQENEMLNPKTAVTLILDDQPIIIEGEKEGTIKYQGDTLMTFWNIGTLVVNSDNDMYGDDSVIIIYYPDNETASYQPKYKIDGKFAFKDGVFTIYQDGSFFDMNQNIFLSAYKEPIKVFPNTEIESIAYEEGAVFIYENNMLFGKGPLELSGYYYVKLQNKDATFSQIGDIEIIGEAKYDDMFMTYQGLSVDSEFVLDEDEEFILVMIDAINGSSNVANFSIKYMVGGEITEENLMEPVETSNINFEMRKKDGKIVPKKPRFAKTPTADSKGFADFKIVVGDSWFIEINTDLDTRFTDPDGKRIDYFAPIKSQKGLGRDLEQLEDSLKKSKLEEFKLENELKNLNNLFYLKSLENTNELEPNIFEQMNSFEYVKEFIKENYEDELVRETLISSFILENIQSFMPDFEDEVTIDRQIEEYYNFILANLQEVDASLRVTPAIKYLFTSSDINVESFVMQVGSLLRYTPLQPEEFMKVIDRQLQNKVFYDLTSIAYIGEPNQALQDEHVQFLRAGLVYDDTSLVTEEESVSVRVTSGIPTGRPITVKRFNLLKDLSKAYAAKDDLGNALATNQLLARELNYELLENYNQKQDKGITNTEIPSSNSVDVREFTAFQPFKKQEVSKEDEILVDKEKQLKFLWNQAQEEKARLADVGFNKLYLQLVTQREKIEESSKLREGTLESEYGDMSRYSLSEKSAGIVFYVLSHPFKGGYVHDIVNVAGGFKEVKEKIKVLDEENQENVRGLVAIQSLVGMGVRSNTIEAWLNDELEDEKVEDMVKLLIVMSGHGTSNPESSPEFSNSMAGMAGSIINVNGEDYGVENDKYNLVFGFLEENKESAKKVYGSDFKFDLEALTGKTIFAYEPGAYSTKYSVDIGGLQRAMFKGEVARVQLKDSEEILRFVDEGLSPGAILLGAATGGFGGTFFSSATGGWGAVLGVAENFVIDTGAGGFMVMNNYDPEEHPFMAMGASVGTGLSTTTVFRLAKGFFKNAFKPAAGLLTEVSDDALHGLGLIRRGDVIYEREYGSKIASANDLKKYLQKVSADSKTAKKFSEELFPSHKPSFDDIPELPKPRTPMAKTTLTLSTNNMRADFLEAHSILSSKLKNFDFYVHGTNGNSLDSILDMGGDLLPGKAVKERGGFMFTGESGGTTGMNSQRVSVVAFDHTQSLKTTQNYAEGAAKPYSKETMDGFSITPSNIDERIEVLQGYLDEFNIKDIPDHAPIMKELKAAEVRIPQLQEMKKVFEKMSAAEIAEYNRLSEIPVVVLGKQMHSEIGQVVSDIPGEVSVPSMRVDIIATPKQHVDEVRSMVRQKGGSAKVVSFEELERLKKGDIIPDIAKRIDEPTTMMYSDDYFDAMKGEDVNDFRLIEKARSALNKQLIDKNTNAVRVSYIQSSFDDWYTGNFNPKTGKIRLYMYYFNKESMPEGILKGNADILPKGYTKYQTKELADKAIARGDEDMAILLSPHETQISDIDGYYQYRATIELDPDEARRMGGGFNEYDEWIGGELPDKTLDLKWKTIGPIKKESIVQVDEVKWIDGDFKINGVEAWHAPDFNHKYVRWVDDLTKEFPPGIEVKVVRTNGQLDVGEVLGPVGENYVRVLVDLDTAYKDIHVDALRAWNKDLLDSRAIAATAESTSLFLRSLNPAKMSVREEEAVYNLFKIGKVSLGDAAPYLKKSIAGKELHDLNEIEILVKLQLGEISKVQADAFIGHAIKRELVDFVSEKNSYLGSLIKKNYHPVQDGALEGVDFYHGMTIDDYHKQVEWGGSYYSDTGKINLNTHSNSAIESRVRVVFHEIAHKLDLRSTAGWFTELRAYNFAYLTAKKLGIKGYLSNLDILANKVVKGKATPEEFIKALEKSGYENPASRRYVNTARLNFLKGEHPEMANRFIQRHRDIITITPPASP